MLEINCQNLLDLVYHLQRTTAYQKDGGIDVILDGKNEQLIGVQVKRYKNSIKVSQIREFAGALVQNNMTKGIYVTTSKFQKGVYESVEDFKKKGIGIELVDSKRFYDALQIRKIEDDTYSEIIARVSKKKLKNLIYYTDGIVEIGNGIQKN